MEKGKMVKNPEVTPELLRELIRYEPETGRFFLKERDPKYFRDQAAAIIWNATNKDKEICNRGQYKALTIFNTSIRAHRAAWAIHYGEWPKGQIDHKNGQTRDNRIANLREATGLINSRNRVMSSNNTSGYTGVRETKSEKWSAHILDTNLGTFDTFEEAIKARDEAQAQAPAFTDRHGKPPIANYGFQHLKEAKKARQAVKVEARRQERLALKALREKNLVSNPTGHLHPAPEQRKVSLTEKIMMTQRHNCIHGRAGR